MHNRTNKLITFEWESGRPVQNRIEQEQCTDCHEFFPVQDLHPATVRLSPKVRDSGSEAKVLFCNNCN